MAKFFIERPVFAVVLAILITLIGGISAFNLPIAQYPQISPPSVRVSGNYQGANADVVEQTVAQTIEEQVNGVEDMVSMSSTSTDSGAYSLSVQFETGKNPDIATVQTQNRISQVNSALPDDVRESGVTAVKSTSDLAMIFSLYSDDNQYDTNFLKTYGKIYLEDDIKRVKGVGDILEFGADYAMRIWLQPDKLAQLGVTVSEVKSAITSQNVQAPAGTIGGRPMGDDQEFQYTARVQGRLASPEEFGNIIIRAQNDGSFIRIKDVARVELGSKDYSVTSMINNKNAVGFAVRLASDANALDTVSQVKQVLQEASKKFPQGLQYKVVVDTTDYVIESMKEVGKTFVEALLLVAFVIFLFLQSGRATLIPMLAVPVSLIGTFGAFIALGFSINTLTLFAMVLAIGLVVDDAIVVIEATEHHMRYNGLSPKEATKRAMDEVQGPVVAIAFVLASVFIPVAFFGGTMGVLYKQFALTVTVSMILSAVVALTLTPALCSMLLKPYDPNAHEGLLAKIFDGFNNWFERLIEGYGARVRSLIRKMRLCMVFLLIIIVASAALAKIVPSAFIPQEDQGYFIVSFNLPEASSLERTKDAMMKLVDKIHQQPGVKNAMSVAGYDLLGGGAKPNTATMFIGLDPWSERENPQLKIDAQIGQVFAAGTSSPEGSVLAINPPSLPGLGVAGGLSLYLQDRSGGTVAQLEEQGQAFMNAVRQRPEVGVIYTTFKANTPGFEFEIDRDKVQKLGIPLSDVFNALQTYLGGAQINDFNKFGRTFKVMLQADVPYRNAVEDTRYFFLKSSSGAMVPLDTLLKPKSTVAPTLITRFNAAKAIQFNASPAAGYSTGQAMTAIEEVAEQTLPSGLNVLWAGQSREEKVSSGKTPIVFGFALLFAFLCLAALYESWSVPFAVLLCVPCGIFGAFLCQYLRGLEDNIYMQIGLVMLIGLAAKNAILIVEFAKVRVDKGMEPVQAAIEACKIRLRPILMTSLAFIIGCLPLAVATGAGAGARNSMGTTVVGGMFAATLLGIFIIPVLFVVVEKLTDKIYMLSHKGAHKPIQVEK